MRAKKLRTKVVGLVAAVRLSALHLQRGLLM